MSPKKKRKPRPTLDQSSAEEISSIIKNIQTTQVTDERLGIDIHNACARESETDEVRNLRDYPATGDLKVDSLACHNECREKHGVPPLQWSEKLAKNAQKWADHLGKHGKLQHSNVKKRKGEGENIFCSQGHDLNGYSATMQWYSEIENYDFTSKPTYNPNAGHFTQVVWAETRELGVGRSKSKKGMEFVVARYFPVGNHLNKFERNIKPPVANSQANGSDESLSDVGASNGGVENHASCESSQGMEINHVSSEMSEALADDHHIPCESAEGSAYHEPSEFLEGVKNDGPCDISEIVEIHVPYESSEGVENHIPCDISEIVEVHVACESPEVAENHVSCDMSEIVEIHVPYESPEDVENHVPCDISEIVEVHIPSESPDGVENHVPCDISGIVEVHVPGESPEGVENHVPCDISEIVEVHVPCESPGSGENHVSCDMSEIVEIHVPYESPEDIENHVPCDIVEIVEVHVPGESPDGVENHVPCDISEVVEYREPCESTEGVECHEPCESPTGVEHHVTCEISEDIKDNLPYERSKDVKYHEPYEIYEGVKYHKPCEISQDEENDASSESSEAPEYRKPSEGSEGYISGQLEDEMDHCEYENQLAWKLQFRTRHCFEERDGKEPCTVEVIQFSEPVDQEPCYLQREDVYLQLGKAYILSHGFYS